MASCDWQKKKGSGEAKALFRHCDKEERKKANHSNKDIDKSRTHLNMSFGVYNNQNGTGYEEICKAYDDYISDLDSRDGANKRKDRVTLCALNLPVPAGMDDDTAQLWCIEAYEVLYDCYGERLLGGTAHFDEKHNYIDAETKEKRESRVHLHAQVIPDVDGRLNAKALMSRSNMIILNNRIHEMTKTRFPGYVFMDGTKRKSKKPVEELKQESDVLAIIDEAQREASKIVEEARQRADRLDAEAVEKLEKAEKYAVEKRRKVSDEVESMREFAVKMSDDMKRDAQTSSEAILSNAKAEADKLMLEAEKTLKTANMSLQRAKQKANELKQKEDELEQAKLLYQSAFDDAQAIAKGFAEEAFYKRFYDTFRQSLENTKYNNGRTGLDYFGKQAQKAFEEAKKVTKHYNTSPMDAYTERVEERVQRADEHVRKARELPNMPHMNNNGHDTEFSL